MNEQPAGRKNPSIWSVVCGVFYLIKEVFSKIIEPSPLS